MRIFSFFGTLHKSLSFIEFILMNLGYSKDINMYIIFKYVYYI